jgi:2-amino-4-hydroxy-6-hydroxymethyldihydropteridine diphosphokinase
LDLDVLLYDDLHMADAKLTIPHPRMWQRAFVLWPLQELAPDRVSPDHLAAVAPQRVEKIRR